MPALSAAAVSRTPDTAQPSWGQLDLFVAVQDGVKRDVVGTGVEMAKHQSCQGHEPSGGRGLVDIEI